MSVTPNFNWPLIEPTDFVTNLPADFEAFGDAVDLDVDAIKTTADAAIPETIIDAAGDLIYGTADNTADRLAIGTAGQVLLVNSGATAPEWGAVAADSLTQIATSTFSSVSSVSITSIPGTYKSLKLIVKNYEPSSGDVALRMQYNSDTNTNYTFASSVSTNNANKTFSEDSNRIAIFSWNGASTSWTETDIFNYADATTWKGHSSRNWGKSNSDQSNIGLDFNAGFYNQTTAITSIQIFPESGTMSGTYILYGVK